MKWNTNLARIYNDGIVGECPYCKSTNTDYMFYGKQNGRSYLEIWCNACAERIHVDCGKIPPNRKHEYFDTMKNESNLFNTDMSSIEATSAYFVAIENRTEKECEEIHAQFSTVMIEITKKELEIAQQGCLC